MKFKEQKDEFAESHEAREIVIGTKRTLNFRRNLEQSAKRLS